MSARAAFEAIGMGTMGDVIAGTFTQIGWAEEEIEAAQGRHPEQADVLWGSFLRLRATHDLMRSEFVYRAHARALLERVAAGEDTRPPTDAELACALSEESMAHPLGTGATTLYMRVFQRAFPEQAETFGIGTMESHEQVGGQQADDFERELRRKLRQEWRR